MKPVEYFVLSIYIVRCYKMSLQLEISNEIFYNFCKFAKKHKRREFVLTHE